MDRALICQKLGLDPAKATDEEILAAIDGLIKAQADAATAQADCKAAKDALAQIQAKQLDSDCDAFIAANKARIKPNQEDAVRAQFRAAPDATRALFGALADPGPAARQIARSDGRTPADRDGTDDKASQRAALIARVAARDSISRREAVSVARREQPELFKETT